MAGSSGYQQLDEATMNIHLNYLLVGGNAVAFSFEGRGPSNDRWCAPRLTVQAAWLR
jgi:hypothetical protein